MIKFPDRWKCIAISIYLDIYNNTILTYLKPRVKVIYIFPPENIKSSMLLSTNMPLALQRLLYPMRCLKLLLNAVLPCEMLQQSKITIVGRNKNVYNKS